MFPTRLTEVTAAEVQAVIDNEVAETIEFELKRDLPSKKAADPWMSGGKLGDDAKDELAAEIIAFANTVGGTVIVGIGEDTATKRAKPPICPVPNCKDAAARLHQAISDRIEPKLPVFESEGVVTESDGTSGVVIMRTLESYLAPHRHTQVKHCYIRRNDRAEPMSMLEIQEMTRRKSRSLEEIEKAFAASADKFFNKWLPVAWRLTHLPTKVLAGDFKDDGHGDLAPVGRWAMRLTARPLGQLSIADVSRQRWITDIGLEEFKVSGRQSWPLKCRDWNKTGPWRPRLRSVEREFKGNHLLGVDRITSEAEVERYLRVNMEVSTRKPFPISASDLMWNFVSVVRIVDIVSAQLSRPTQTFGLEVEFLMSDPMLIHPCPPAQLPFEIQPVPVEGIVFPRYEIGDRGQFNELLTLFDRDVWNLSSYNSDRTFEIDWPSAIR